jgi:hypothetical protein
MVNRIRTHFDLIQTKEDSCRRLTAVATTLTLFDMSDNGTKYNK